MKQCMIIVLALSACVGLCNAAITVVQDYESYATTLELLNAHSVTDNLTITLNTATVHSGTKAMKYAYNNGASPYYAIARYNVPGAVWQSYGANWNDYSKLSVWYYVEKNGGSEHLKIQLVNAWGTTLYNQDIGVVPAGLGWQEAVIDLHAHLTPAQLEHVGRIDLIMSAGNYGQGVVYFDDITLIPEPATLVLLGAGGLLLRRRRK